MVTSVLPYDRHDHLMINDGLLRTLAELIRIRSVNSAYELQSSEAEIQSWIASFFGYHRIETAEQQVLPGRSNVIGKLPGKSSRRLVFEAHCDTVSAEGMNIPPFDPQIRRGRIYGRGSCDTKAGLAAMMHALVDLKRAHVQPPCEVWVVSAIDEEHAHSGAVKLCQDPSSKRNLKMMVDSSKKL
jgi:acetylornithine deacetylase/succinyl-diaminopimelate desuccinylase-like protein